MPPPAQFDGSQRSHCLQALLCDGAPGVSPILPHWCRPLPHWSPTYPARLPSLVSPIVPMVLYDVRLLQLFWTSSTARVPGRRPGRRPARRPACLYLAAALPAALPTTLPAFLAAALPTALHKNQYIHRPTVETRRDVPFPRKTTTTVLRDVKRSSNTSTTVLPRHC